MQITSEDADSAELGGTAMEAQALETEAPAPPLAAPPAAATAVHYVADDAASGIDGDEKKIAGSKTNTPREDNSSADQAGGSRKFEEMLRSLGVVEEDTVDDDEAEVEMLHVV